MNLIDALITPSTATRARQVGWWTVATMAGCALGYGLGRGPTDRRIDVLAMDGLGHLRASVVAFACLDVEMGLLVSTLQAWAAIAPPMRWRWGRATVMGSAIDWAGAPAVSDAMHVLHGWLNDFVSTLSVGVALGGMQALTVRPIVTRPRTWIGANALSGAAWLLGWFVAHDLGIFAPNGNRAGDGQPTF